MRLTKTFPASYSVKDDGDAGWEIEGYASVFGTEPDAYGDIVFKNAFAKTIKERVPAGKVRFFYEHGQVLGVPLSIEEDDTGLKVRARISKTTLGHDVRTLLADGAISDLSIGYDLIGDKNEPNSTGGINIREARLFEFSLVGLGAQDEAMIANVKALTSEQAAIRAELANLRKAIPDPPKDEEKPMDIKVDDWVSWGSDSEDAPIGKVVSLHTDGPVPDVEGDLEGTEEEPAAKIQVYEKSEDSESGWKPTDKHVGHKVSTLTVVEEPEIADADEEGKAAEDVPADEEEESEAPSAAEVRAALKTLQALVDAYEEPSKDTLAEDSEPPSKDGDEEADKALHAELDAMKSL